MVGFVCSVECCRLWVGLALIWGWGLVGMWCAFVLDENLCGIILDSVGTV